MKCFNCKQLMNPVLGVCDFCDTEESNEDSYDEYLQQEIEDIVNVRGVTPRRYIE